MNLVKTSLLNSIAITVRVVSAIVINKILAVYVGPAGYAIIGQFQNAVSVIVSLAGGIVTIGVTKATAELHDDEKRQHEVWQTALRFSLGASLIAAAILLFLREWLSDWLLLSADMSTVFLWLAAILPAVACNNILLAIINGKKEVGVFVTVNIVGSLISMLVTGALALQFGLYGALVAFTINPAIVSLVTAAIVVRCDWFKVKFLWGKINVPAFHELSGFGLMSIASALTVPITFMLIRDILTTNLDLTAAGYWQASWKISEIYLMLVTSTLSLYYLPRLAEITTALDLKAEIFKVYRFVMPIVVVGAVAIYILRDFIISILFTSDFVGMRDLFFWQLAGDVVKIASWVCGYVITARGLVKYYIVSEVFSNVLFLALTWWLVRYFGLQGVVISYLLTYIVHLFLMAVLVRAEMGRMEK